MAVEADDNDANDESPQNERVDPDRLDDGAGPDVEAHGPPLDTV